MAKRRKKASKRRKKSAKKGATRVTVSRTALNRVISLGAAHHSSVAKLKRTVKAAPKRKARKKRARR